MPSHVGVIKRIFVENQDAITFVKFTFEGHSSVYCMKIKKLFDFSMRSKLELTSPGDEVCFEYETTGIVMKENILKQFKNMTLDDELNSARAA